MLFRSGIALPSGTRGAGRGGGVTGTFSVGGAGGGKGAIVGTDPVDFNGASST